MCVNQTCEDKCKACFDRGMSCCNELPIMTTEEVARIYYNCKDLKKTKSTLIPVSPNHYVMVKADDVKGEKKIDPSKYKCPLLTEDGKCMVYEYRPKICRDFGTDSGLKCYANDLTTDEVSEKPLEDLISIRDKVNDYNAKKGLSLAMVSKTTGLDSYKYFVKMDSRKYDSDGVRNFKANTVLYYAMYGMEYIKYTDVLDILDIQYSYRLLILEDNSISAIRDNVFKSTKSFSKNYATIHNKVSKYLMTKPLNYHEHLVERLNKIFKGSKDIIIPKEVSDCFINEKDFNHNLLDFIMMVELLLNLTTNKKIPKHIKKYFKDDVKLLKEYRYMKNIAVKRLFHKQEDIPNVMVDDISKVSLFALKPQDNNEEAIYEYVNKLISVRVKDLMI